MGWIPCLALQLSRRSILTEETLHRLRQQLAQMGLDLMPHTPLRFGIQAKLLKVLALSAILRCNDPELEGSWWHRKISPEVELRVAVRYQLQRPARPWRTMSGKAFGPDQLRVAFPRNAFWKRFAAACPTWSKLLPSHGDDHKPPRLRLQHPTPALASYHPFLRFLWLRALPSCQPGNASCAR